jgi:TPR repeat protein
MTMTNLRSLYGAGVGVRQDFVEARRWFEKGAAAGSDEAMFQLGLMMRDGDGVLKNGTAAKTWFEKAAALGNAR